MDAGEPAQPDTTGRWRRIGRRSGCAAIASAAVVMCGFTVGHGFSETRVYQSPAAVRAAAHGYRIEECTYRVIREVVPKGARVFVPDYWEGGGVRLTDLQTGWSVPEADPSNAQYTLSAGPGPLCSRQMMAVRPR